MMDNEDHNAGWLLSAQDRVAWRAGDKACGRALILEHF